MRLLADDSSLFTRVEEVNETHEKLIKDLQTVTDWAYLWKMVFNPDITKQAIEIIFSVKKKKRAHPELFFNGVPVSREGHTNHLGVYLDNQLNFSKHIRESILKATKGVSLLKYLSKYVSRRVLDLSYKLYVRPHLDYGDVIRGGSSNFPDRFFKSYIHLPIFLLVSSPLRAQYKTHIHKRARTNTHARTHQYSHTNTHAHTHTRTHTHTLLRPIPHQCFIPTFY